MFARLRFPVFVDSVVFDFPESSTAPLRAILRDEQGTVCSSLNASIPKGASSYHWRGLNDLPYGVYTLEYRHGEFEQSQRMVKRV
jgi:hypothetical protein